MAVDTGYEVLRAAQVSRRAGAKKRARETATGKQEGKSQIPGRDMMMMRQKVRPVYGFWVPIKKRKVRVFPVEHFVLKYGAVDRFNRS